MKKFYYAIIGLSMMLFSCNKNTSINTAQSTENKKIEISTHINGYLISRSPKLDQNGDGNFVNTDEYTVFFSKNHIIKNLTFGNNKINYWNDIKSLTQNENILISSVYPITTSTDGKFIWRTYNDNIHNDDLIIADNKQINVGEPITLNFKHAMCKLIINLTNGQGIQEENLSNVSINIKNIHCQCKVNINDDSIISYGEKSTITKVGKQIVLLFPPQELNGVKLSYIIDGQESTEKDISTYIQSLQSNKCVTISYLVVKNQNTDRDNNRYNDNDSENGDQSGKNNTEKQTFDINVGISDWIDSDNSYSATIDL